jgi:hypothetical protein
VLEKLHDFQYAEHLALLFLSWYSFVEW